MDHSPLSLCTGAVAGTPGTLPKAVRKRPFRSRLTAFPLHPFAGIPIFRTDFPHLPRWAAGMAATATPTLPMVETFTGKDRKAIPAVPLNALLPGFLPSAAERYPA